MQSRTSISPPPWISRYHPRPTAFLLNWSPAARHRNERGARILKPQRPKPSFPWKLTAIDLRRLFARSRHPRWKFLQLRAAPNSRCAVVSPAPVSSTVTFAVGRRAANLSHVLRHSTVYVQRSLAAGLKRTGKSDSWLAIWEKAKEQLANDEEFSYVFIYSAVWWIQ